MLLRKKKSKGEVLTEKVGDLWESASQTVSGKADSLASTVGPKFDDARQAAAPVVAKKVADTQDRARDAAELSKRQARRARKRAAELAALGAAAAAAKAKSQADADADAEAEAAKPKKKHRIRRFVFVAAVGGAIAFAVKKLTSAPSGGSYTPPPPPPEPIRPNHQTATPPSPSAAQPPEGLDDDALGYPGAGPGAGQGPTSDKI
ncbi:hypothetical protein KV100_09800 [Mumia sp. zg.B21]|uniref:hypothetical protein n=1 Tax=Mumia sp. zg.B21 TaxID=2855447 RepID=UPI001C6E3584|nr:hypothetical protein [Mumia sp. zg.B21]MBW9209953.1 hypothetical protein [Mumia sp. zg.B21]